MNKWVVRKHLLGTDWFVWLRGHPQRWRFDTWREAMDYADRMARTVEVTLPRVHALPTDRHSVRRDGMIVEFAGSRSHSLPLGRIAVEPWERRPLALALLALAEKEANR